MEYEKKQGTGYNNGCAYDGNATSVYGVCSGSSSGALDGTLKIKGSASVGSTLSADLSKIKPAGVTSEYVSFSWSLKDGDLLTEVGTGKSYKVDEKLRGFQSF